MYHFVNTETGEIFSSNSLKLIYHIAVRELKEYFRITEDLGFGTLYKTEGDSPFDARKIIGYFPNMPMLREDISKFSELTVRGYNTAKRNGLNTGMDIYSAMREKRLLRGCGIKTRREWEEYLIYCITTIERPENRG